MHGLAEEGAAHLEKRKFPFLFSHKILQKRRINHIPKTIRGFQMACQYSFIFFAQFDINREYIDIDPHALTLTSTLK